MKISPEIPTAFQAQKVRQSYHPPWRIDLLQHLHVDQTSRASKHLGDHGIGHTMQLGTFQRNQPGRKSPHRPLNQNFLPENLT